MCGIAGIIGKNPSEERIIQMLEVQKHRGPDHTGIFRGNHCLLGHNRLAIIDLSDHANQPFTDPDKRYTLVFNGEIYNYLELKEQCSNYRFQTNSDTEVILAAYLQWGKDCLAHFNGMFSFAIWDEDTQELFAARDRFGVKPFFYSLENDELVFASEIKTIHASGLQKEADPIIWANYFAYGSYGMLDETFWKGVKQLPGGNFMLYKKGELTIKKWYHFEREVAKYDQNLSFEEVKEHYEKLLLDSIRLRFRSDVQVGFNISGGLDSSALLSMVNEVENGDDIQAFTFYTHDDRYDELPWVEKLIALTGNPLNTVLLSATEVDELSHKISWHQDEPFGGIPSLAYAKIFQEARKKEVIVLLDGQGMDEQWAGYDYYFKTSNSHTIQGVTKSPFRQNVLSEDFKSLATQPKYPKPFTDELLNKQYRDLFYTKIPRALRFNDRISMAFSTELREPFLDYRLVEFAFAQPKEFKISKGIQKKLLRDLVKEYLHDDITYAPKRALQTPQREWLGNELSDTIDQGIETIKKSKYAHWFDLNALEQEWQFYLDGDQDSSFHIWQWFNFSLLMANR